MTLPSSGDIKLSQLIAEFGGGTKLTNFYRGGGLVPNIPANSNVPTSGTIKLTNFYGASSGTQVMLAGASVNAPGSTTANRVARYRLTSAGVEEYKEGTSGYTAIGNWLLAGTAANYDVRFTRTSTTGAGTSDASTGWLNLGTTREITAISSAANYQAVYTVDIVATGTTSPILATASASLSSTF